MTPEDIVAKAQADLGDALTSAEVTLGDAVLHCAPESLHAVAQYLRDTAELRFDYFSHVSGVDYLKMDRDPRFEAVYELHSMEHGHTVRVRVGLDEADPTVPTVTDLWAGAVFPEQELFDMFGFHIEGHPNLKRLIMPEGWEGHPLLKDYPLVVEDIAFSHNPDHKSELIKTKEELKAE